MSSIKQYQLENVTPIDFVLSERLDRHQGELTYRYSYLNYTNDDIILMKSNGIKHTLYPRKTNEIRPVGVMIYITITLAEKEYLELIDNISKVAVDKNNYPLMLVRITEAVELLQKDESGTRYTPTKVVSLECFIPEDRLKENAVYVRELNIVLATKSNSDRVHHPFTKEYVNEMLDTPIGGNKEGLKIEVIIIDNDNVFKSYFYKIGDEVMLIKSIAYPNSENCIIIKTIDTNGNSNVKFYPLDEDMWKLNIYETKSIALDNGDFNEQRKREQREREHLFNLKQAEEMVKREREKTEEEERRRYIKDRYEERSYARKDSSESLKHLPLLIAGLGASFLAFNKLIG